MKLSKFELEIMDLFWDAGETSIRDVLERIPEDGRPAYTTVQTIVTRLEAKGALGRTRKAGNAYLYKPLVTRKSAYRRVIDDVLRLFGGEAQPLVAHLLETRRLSLKDLRDLEAVAKKQERQR
ncbi:MAG: BlaI/MecI/CopY family transcriptional regulator [Thermoanaerobaculia bacterium]